MARRKLRSEKKGRVVPVLIVGDKYRGVHGRRDEMTDGNLKWAGSVLWLPPAVISGSRTMARQQRP